MVGGWRALTDELDAWAAVGRDASLWWRDDDAAESTAALARLIDIAGAAEVPLCLAVIPAAATPALAASLADAADGVVAVPHGYTHRNHAPTGRRKAEFPAERALDSMIGELARAWSLTAERFGARALPVLVPPWNRIAGDLIPRLPEAGYRGISAMAPSGPPPPVAGLRRRDVHVDIIDWRGSRAFVGETAALAAIVKRLATLRLDTGGSAQPLGILTHHLMHDEAAWCFLEKFAALTRGHRSVRWPSVATIFTF